LSSRLSRTFTIGGAEATVRIYPAKDKSAPSIIALHGFTGSGMDFDPLRTAVGMEDWHWICPDFIGHGLSQSPVDLEPYSLENSLRLIDLSRSCAPSGSNVHLLGYSMGGRIALHYLKAAKTFLPAVLIGASPGLASGEERGIRFSQDQRVIGILKEDGIDDFAQFWESQPVIAPQKELPEPLRSELAERRRSNSVQGLVNALMASGTAALPSLWDSLDSIAGLTCLFGEFDAKFRSVTEQMIRKNSDIRGIEVPGTGHAPHLEAPELLATFLQSAFSH